MCLKKIIEDLNLEKDNFDENDFNTIINLLKTADANKEERLKKENERKAETNLTAEENEKPSSSKTDLAEKYKQEGNNHFKSKNYDDAILSYTQAIEEDPTNHVFYSNRAAAYACLEMNENGIEDCLKAIEICPTFVKAYIRMGDFYINEGNTEKALEFYEKGLKLEPKNVILSQKINSLTSSLEKNKNDVDLNDTGNLKNMNFAEMMKDPKIMEMAKNFMKGKNKDDIEKMMNSFKNMKKE